MNTVLYFIKEGKRGVRTLFCEDEFSFFSGSSSCAPGKWLFFRIASHILGRRISSNAGGQYQCGRKDSFYRYMPFHTPHMCDFFCRWHHEFSCAFAMSPYKKVLFHIGCKSVFHFVPVTSSLALQSMSRWLWHVQVDVSPVVTFARTSFHILHS